MHRQLKAWIAGEDAPQEVRVGRYRVDAVVEGRLIEVQVSSLAALSRKLHDLLSEHRVRVVKPVVARKAILRRIGRTATRRWSPKRGGWIDLFDELVYLTGVLPHPGLEIQALLVEVEEERRPKPAERCRWKRANYEIDDRRLTAVVDERMIRAPSDLWQLLPPMPKAPFDTAELAAACGIPRWRAQRVAYTLSRSGAAKAVGKRGRSQLYAAAAVKRAARGRTARRPAA